MNGPGKIGPFLAWLAVVPGAVAAEPLSPSSSPILITAEDVTHDRDVGIITARGHVEIAAEDHILQADSVSYHTKQNLVVATGHVSLLDPEGQVMFADYFELTDDLKKGVARQIRILLADRSRLAAVSGIHDASRGEELHKAVYTACRPCTENAPPTAPLWQIKALQVTHDTKRQEIEYRDAWLEMWGIPIAYTPYFSHPNPRVKRRSGFLTPTWGGTRGLGGMVRIPYFWELSPHADVTLEPLFSSRDRPALMTEYRHALANGNTRNGFSVTRDKHDTVRGYIDSDTVYEISDTSRARVLIERITDNEYMRRYGFGRKAWLTSHATFERFGPRSYGTAYAYTFQGLRATSDPGHAPLVLPGIEYSHVGDPGWLGGHSFVDASLLALSRAEGSDSRRLSMTGGWTLPYTAPGGDILIFNASVRGDGYWVNDVPVGGRPPFSGTTGRVIPEASVEWRYPLVRRGEGNHTVIEPIAVFIVSPLGGTPVEIPNIDSREFEFDETNLFKTNRFVGLDRVESGPRINYGLKVSQYYTGMGQVGLLIGQSYRFHPQDDFGAESGLEGHFSDVVGRVEFVSTGNLSLSHSFRLNRESFSARRNEFLVEAGPKAFRLGLGYTFINQTLGNNTEFRDRQELTANIGFAISRYWSLLLAGHYDLSHNGGHLSEDVSALYEDECFVLRGKIGWNHTQDRDLKKEQFVTMQVAFKTLGQIQSKLK
ncbi:MAG: LPS-assembly protein [Rhodospirillaceae bacterium]|nr:MAG: LPS-assembly protein [Rhodospirillaceae bacterium]